MLEIFVSDVCLFRSPLMSSCFLESLFIFEYVMLIAFEKFVGTIWDLGWDTFVLSLAHTADMSLGCKSVWGQPVLSFILVVPALFSTEGMIYLQPLLGRLYRQVHFCASLYPEALAFGDPNLLWSLNRFPPWVPEFWFLNFMLSQVCQKQSSFCARLQTTSRKRRLWLSLLL